MRYYWFDVYLNGIPFDLVLAKNSFHAVEKAKQNCGKHIPEGSTWSAEVEK